MNESVVGVVVVNGVGHELLSNRQWRIRPDDNSDSVDTFVLEIIGQFMEHTLQIGPSDGWPLPAIFNDVSEYLQDTYPDAKATLLVKAKNDAFPGAVY